MSIYLPSGWSMYKAIYRLKNHIHHFPHRIYQDYFPIPCPSPFLFPIAFLLTSFIFSPFDQTLLTSYEFLPQHVGSYLGCTSASEEGTPQTRTKLALSPIAGTPATWQSSHPVGACKKCRWPNTRAYACCWPIPLFPHVVLKFLQDKKLLLNNPPSRVEQDEVSWFLWQLVLVLYTSIWMSGFQIWKEKNYLYPLA